MRLPSSRPLVLSVTVSLLVAVSGTSWAQGRRGPLRIERLAGRSVAAGEALVKLRAGASSEAFAAVARAAGADSHPVGRIGVHLVRARGLGTAGLIARLRGQPDVEFVEPNFVVRVDAEPNDPLLPSLWGLRNTGQAVNGGLAGTPGADIHAEAAWDVSLGSTAHVVAVVDTGVDYRHPDLAANMWSAPAAFTVTIGGATLTCPAGSHGFDAIAFSCDPMDDHHHGTHVAGTIGAVGGNAAGVAGVSWTTRVMAIKFLDATGSGTIADAITGLEFVLQARQAFAATGGADVRVLSNSWGGHDFSQALLDEIAVTDAAGMLFVAAAGNDGFSNDLWPTYPASYAVPNVVAVAATTNTDGRAWFSNYGTGSVHLGAPGVDILSTLPSASYGYSSGTSMAAPHVSGAAALVLSRCDLDTPSLKQAVVATAEKVPGLASYTISGARLDVNSAVRSCAGPPPAPEDLTASPGNGLVTLAWTRVAGATSYEVKRSLAAGGPYDAVSTVTNTTATDAAVTNGTTYFYVVAAVNLAGPGPDSAEASATPKAPSDLVVSSLTVPSLGGAGLPLAVSSTTRNQGTGASLATTTRIYLSRNSLVDASDTPLGQTAVPTLAPAAQYDAAHSLVLPAGLAAGYYYVIARADADGVEAETQEANNTTSRLVTIGPDLAVPAMTAPLTAAAGAPLTISVTTKNQGGGDATASVTRFYLSANALWESTDTPLAGGADVAALAPGASQSSNVAVTIPAGTAAGSYYVIARADGDGAVVETQEANNSAARLVQVGGDLIVSAITAPARAGASATIVVSDTTKNGGAGPVAGSVTRFFVSSNALLDAGDVPLAGGRAVPALTAGATSSGSTTVTLPPGLTVGTWFLIAKADADGAVAETLETNNTLARSFTVGPDLVVSAMSVPYNVRAGAVVTIADTVANQGADAAGASMVRYYLSTNTALDAGDVRLDGARAVAALAAGGASSGSAAVTIPAGTASGTWFVIAVADADATVTESTESNNAAARAVSVAP